MLLSNVIMIVLSRFVYDDSVNNLHIDLSVDSCFCRLQWSSLYVMDCMSVCERHISKTSWTNRELIRGFSMMMRYINRHYLSS